MSLKMLTITIVRHGESSDNLLPDVWTGWRDAPLTGRGRKQAQALGRSLAHIPFAVIYTSPLARAYNTAQAVYDAQPDPKPKFTSSPLLRAQHYGVAEGALLVRSKTPGVSLEEHFQQGIYPVVGSRSEKFPGGESSDDVALRAEQVVQELILPHVLRATHGGSENHIAIVSHGPLIVELIPALLKRDPNGVVPEEIYPRMTNTGWTRVVIGVKVSDMNTISPSAEIPPLEARVTNINRHEHMISVGGFGISTQDKITRALSWLVDQDPKNEENKSHQRAMTAAKFRLNL